MARHKPMESERLLALSFDVQGVAFRERGAGHFNPDELEQLIYAADLIRDAAQRERDREAMGPMPRSADVGEGA